MNLNMGVVKVDAAIDRFKGCLVGLAVGDALGAPVEFKKRGRFEPVRDLTAGGPFRVQVGQWTDDTSMALCLAASLVERGGMDLAHQMELYSRWMNEGFMSCTGKCFGIGQTVFKAIGRYDRDGNPLAGTSKEREAGNGSLMRLAPVAMFHHSDALQALRACAESSFTTHGNYKCLDACRYFGGLLWGALNGVSKEELLSELWAPVMCHWSIFPLCQDIMKVAAGSYKTKSRDEIKSTGYVVHTLEAALYSIYITSTYKDAVLCAVNLGGDADTVGAVTGQLAGAVYGYEQIPRAWREAVAMRNVIEEYAVRLMRIRA